MDFNTKYNTYIQTTDYIVTLKLFEFCRGRQRERKIERDNWLVKYIMWKIECQFESENANTATFKCSYDPTANKCTLTVSGFLSKVCSTSTLILITVGV